MVGERLSQYQIIKELGRGGMGVVYKATDTELQRDVALKVMTSLELASEEARSRFRLEGQAAAQLNHPNIATIYQIGEDQGKMFIAMEFIEGSTVEHILETGDLSFENAMRIGVQLADGLAAAHIHGVVHRDIKPANVMVDGSGRVKILDFGLAKMEQDSNLTAKGATVGTFAYMSPEQLRGESVGAATDAWAFGVVLYEMLAGKRPFEAAYDAALSFQILNEDPPELDESIPEDLREGIGTLLTKDEDTRNKDVQAVVSGYGGSRAAISAVRAAPAKARNSSRNRIIAVSAVLSLIIVGLIYFFAWPQQNVGRTALDGIAVFPFTVSGSDELGDFANGFARLLADKLEDSGAVRPIDYSTLERRIERDGLDVASPEEARLVASEYNAAGYIFGNVLQIPGSIVISASLFNVLGEEEAEASLTIEQESEILRAVDELGRELLASKYHITGDQLRSAAVLTTESYPALKLYLKGMDQLRAAEFNGAFVSFKEATELDSTFAMAWYGLGRAGGWGSNPKEGLETYYQNAFELGDRLPRRIRDRLDALMAFRRGDAAEAITIFERQTREYPDDADAWGLLGDVSYHYNRLLGRPMSAAVSAMERSLEIDPENREMVGHLAFLKLDEGDYEAYRTLGGFTDAGPFLSEWLPAFFEDSLRMDSPVTDSILASDDWNSLPAHILFWAEDPWAVEQYINKVFDVRGFEAREELEIWSGISLFATGRMDKGWTALKASRRTGNGLDMILLAASPTLYEAPLDILKEGLTEHRAILEKIGSASISDDRKNGVRYRGAELALVRRNFAEVDSFAAVISADTSEVAQSLVLMLNARRAIVDGRFADALSDASAAFLTRPLRAVRTFFSWEFHSRWIRIEALYGLNRHREVVQWLDLLGDGDAGSGTGIDGVLMPRYWAASAFMRGKSNMALEHYDEAEKDFTRFIELFVEADDVYQHLVTDAREELARISDIRVREPSS